MKLERNADNSDLLACIIDNHGKILYESETSILLKDEAMPCYYIHCTDLNEMDEIMKWISADDKCPIVVHEKELMNYFPNYELDLACVNVAYFKETIEIPTTIFPIVELTEKDWEKASWLYRKMPDNAYVLHRLKSNTVIGMFDGDKLVGMIGTHDEGSIGMLEIDPDYRRHHLATALESAAIDRQIKKGVVVFAQIATSNEASFGLQKKLGMERGERIIYWLKHKK